MKYNIAIVTQMYTQYHIFYVQAGSKDNFLERMPLCIGEILEYKRKGKNSDNPPKVDLHIELYNKLKDESIQDSSGAIYIHISNSFNELSDKCGTYHYRSKLWSGAAPRSASKESTDYELSQKHNKKTLAGIIGKYFPLV